MAGYRSHTILAAATRTNSVFTKPENLSVGDEVIIAFDIENDIAPTVPSHWLLLDNIDHTAQLNDLWAWKFKATQADVNAASFTVTHASTWTNGVCVAVMSGSDDAPVRISLGSQGTGTTATANSITTFSDNAWVGFLAVTFGDMGAITPPSGTTPTFTERYESTNNIYLAEGTLATAGSTGNKSITFGASQAWMALLIVVENAGYVSPYPYVVTAVSEIGTSLGSANAQPLPTDSAVDDLILAFAVNDNTGATNMSASTGWVGDALVGTSAMESNVYARVLTGITGDNILALTGAAQDYASLLVRITNHGLAQSDLAQWMIDCVASITGASGNIDPPSVTPPGGSADYLWITAGMLDMTATGDVISSDPAGYFALASIKSAASTSSVGLRVARKTGTQTTEDPATFVNTSRAWHAWTIAVPPASPVTPPTLPQVYLKTGGVWVQHSLKTKIAGAFNG